MKKSILLLMMPLALNAQRLVENKKDDMTGRIIKVTSKERITGGMSSDWIKAGASKVDSAYALNFITSMGGSFFIVSKGGKAIIKFSNDSTATLYSISTEGAKEGMGGKQANLIYRVRDKGLFLNNDIKKIRIYTTEGYKDFEIPQKNADVIKKELLLLE